MHAVGAKQKQVADLQHLASIVDLQMGIHTHGAAQIIFFSRYPSAVIHSELLESTLTDTVNATVANVKNMGGG